MLAQMPTANYLPAYLPTNSLRVLPELLEVACQIEVEYSGIPEDNDLGIKMIIQMLLVFRCFDG